MALLEQFGVAFGSVLAAVAASGVAWYSSRTRAGRLGRTLEQVTKVCDAVDRLKKSREGLTAPEDVETTKLLQSLLTAVHEDFESERQALPQFQRSTSTFRRTFLLFVPSRPSQWLMQVPFHAALILTIAVLMLRVARFEWFLADTLVVGIALMVAVVLRLLVVTLYRQVPLPGSVAPDS
jgi:hypothetical protein